MRAGLIRPLGTETVSLKSLCFGGVKGEWSESCPLPVPGEKAARAEENVPRVADILPVACV